jgi:hypothetical protein
MKLNTLLNFIIKVMFVPFLLSCGPLERVDSRVTWKVVNNSSEILTIRKIGKDGGYADFKMYMGDKYTLTGDDCYHSDTSLFRKPSDDYLSVCVLDSDSCYFSEELMSNKINWNLSIRPGDSIPDGEGPSFNEYDTWYDYTFTITDEMLEAARKGGGE